MLVLPIGFTSEKTLSTRLGGPISVRGGDDLPSCAGDPNEIKATAGKWHVVELLLNRDSLHHFLQDKEFG
jgi:hypothetical protein